jgi:hypothetical protein
MMIVRKIVLASILLVAIGATANAKQQQQQEWVLHFYLIGGGPKAADMAPPAPTRYLSKMACEMDAQRFSGSMQPWNPTCVAVPLR